MNATSFEISFFAYLVTKPIAWFRKADSCLDAAAPIEPSLVEYHSGIDIKDPASLLKLVDAPSAQPSYFMLMALAAENYIKGVYVRHNGKLIRRQAKSGKVRGGTC